MREAALEKEGAHQVRTKEDMSCEELRGIEVSKLGDREVDTQQQVAADATLVKRHYNGGIEEEMVMVVPWWNTC